jgi:exopolysaccharide biosynthesis predicted pyruvyltransferase EpsI
MSHFSTPEQVKDHLHKALEPLGAFDQCALLDYPDYLNIGDHLIWLGTVFYLTDILKTQIKYAASVKSFSEVVMEEKIGKSPILFQGGGNLGDLWPQLQEFRERVISKYQDRPIIILPQTIFFKNPDNLKKAADIFNSHPNLTLFARENYSYEIAINNFSNCRVLKAPDMAFNLVNMPGLNWKIKQKEATLYHCRRDYQPFSVDEINLPNIVVEDWISYQWMYREAEKAWYWNLPGAVRLYREGWQRGLGTPQEWISRQGWQNLHPYTSSFKTLYDPALYRKSWNLMHSGIYQLKQYPFIITNRMHGHVLCLILGIPHVFLPGSYHKNQSFYETWTHDIPFCTRATEASEVAMAAQRLLKI